MIASLSEIMECKLFSRLFAVLLFACVLVFTADRSDKNNTILEFSEQGARYDCFR